MLVVGELNLENFRRDIIVSNKYEGLQHVSIFHRHTWHYNTHYYFHMANEVSNWAYLIIKKNQQQIQTREGIQLQCMSSTNTICIIDQINLIHIYATVDYQSKR